MGPLMVMELAKLGADLALALAGRVNRGEAVGEARLVDVLGEDGVLALVRASALQAARERVADKLPAALPPLDPRAAEMAAVLADVAGSGVQFEDPRYVVAQIDRATWEHVRRLCPSPPQAPQT